MRLSYTPPSDRPMEPAARYFTTDPRGGALLRWWKGCDRYDATVDDWVPAHEMGRYIIGGDTMLDLISTAEAAAIMDSRRDSLRRSAPKPVDDPVDDPIDSGLAAVRYENVFGHRPRVDP